VRRANLASFSPEQVQFLTYGRGVDTTRMRRELGFSPKYSTAEAFDEFVQARCRGGMLDRERVHRVERVFAGLLGKQGQVDG
jgi:UDP-glucose 4-epimerase